MFDDVLCNVVAVLVDNERGRTGMQFLEHRSPGRLCAVLKHTLDDSAAIWMCSQALHLSSERIDDELYVLGRHPLDSLLYNVITVLIFDAPQHVLLKLFHQ